MTDEIDYISKSWHQGYWVGRGELRPEDVTAETNASYQEGYLMGDCEKGYNFSYTRANPDHWVMPYTPTLHTLYDLENDLVERLDDED